MVKIKQQFSKNKNRFFGKNPCNFITIHETGNTSKGANAQAHANLIDNGWGATWHYTVDDKEIIQSFPDDVQCWHAGDNTGNGNMQSIGIEICVNSDGNYLKAVENAIELVKILRQRHKHIKIDHVVQHNHWSGKNCPERLRSGRNGITWKQFKDRLVEKDKIYRVQVGAFRDVKNAEKLVKELKEKGYKDAFYK